MRELTDDGGSGDAQVDEAVRTLETLDGLPVHEHAPVIERAHQVLQDRLSGEPDEPFDGESDAPATDEHTAGAGEDDDVAAAGEYDAGAGEYDDAAAADDDLGEPSSPGEPALHGGSTSSDGANSGGGFAAYGDGAGEGEG